MNRKISTSIVAMTAAFLAYSPASAADVFGSGSTKDSPIVSSSSGAVNFSGFYIGGSLGYGNANHELTLERYNTAYCYDDVGQQPSIAPEDPTNKWAVLGSAYKLDPVPASGLCSDARAANPNNVSDPNGSADAFKVDPSSKEIANLDGLNSSGLVGDVRLGADIQRGRFVFGVYGAYGFNDMTTSGSIGDDISFGIEKGSEWSLGARAGMLVNNRTLLYILAAYTESEFEFSGRVDDQSASKTVDFSGVTVGGGVEFAVTNNVFLGIEGSHTFYGGEKLWDSNDGKEDPSFFGKRLEDEIGETKVMGTLKVKLNSGLPGISD